MINKRIKCPKCGRPLLQGYSYAVVGIQCSCGHYMDIKEGKIIDDEMERKHKK